VGSNDADENPFNIRLRGMCIAPGAVVGTPASEASAPADTIGAWATSLAGSYTGLIKDGTNTVIGRVADLKALPVIPRIRPNPTLEGNILFKGRTVAIKAVISPSGAVAATIPTSKAISTGDMQLALQFFENRCHGESRAARHGDLAGRDGHAGCDHHTGHRHLATAQPRLARPLHLGTACGRWWGTVSLGVTATLRSRSLSSGAVVITGFLGDGTVFNTKSVLNPDGRMVIYHDIVRAGVSRGSIAGTLTMRGCAGCQRLRWPVAMDTHQGRWRGELSRRVFVQVWVPGEHRYTAPATDARVCSRSCPRMITMRGSSVVSCALLCLHAELVPTRSIWTAKNALKPYGPYFQFFRGDALGQLKVLSRPLSTAVIQRTMNMVCLQKQGIAVGYHSTGTPTGRCRIDPGDYPHPGSEYTGAIQRPGQPAVPGGGTCGHSG